MRTERYVTDNPFRVLGTGSAITLIDLRRRADSYARASSVGLAPAVPLADVFASINSTELPSAVRSLANDPERTTLLRILWPLSAQTQTEVLNQGVADELPEEEQLQLAFLALWYRYLLSPDPELAKKALSAWDDLYNCIGMDQRLADLLVEDSGDQVEDPYDAVYSAQRTLALHLLQHVASSGALAWKTGEHVKAAEFVRAVLSSPIDDEMEVRALAPIADAANRLRERVDKQIETMEAWHQGEPTTSADVRDLNELAVLLYGRHPAAEDWSATVANWTTALCWCMRGEAIRLHNEKGQTAKAFDVVMEARRLAVDPEQRTRLDRDLEALREQPSPADECQSPSIMPIERAPVLSTWNGLGTMLYQFGRLRKSKEPYFATLYFVVFFIPVLPIRRYLVKDGEPRGWHFLGTTAWTAPMKIHLAASLVAIGWFSISLITAPSTASTTTSWSPPVKVPQAQKSASTAPVAPQQPATIADGDEETEEVPIAIPDLGAGTQESVRESITQLDANRTRRNRLHEELNALKGEISELESSLETERVELDLQEAALDALLARIESNNPDPYSESEIDDHNAMVGRYEMGRNAFNSSVSLHNNKVNKVKSMIKRHNEIVGILNSDR